jgi:hypothetical protein
LIGFFLSTYILHSHYCGAEVYILIFNNYQFYYNLDSKLKS